MRTRKKGEKDIPQNEEGAQKEDAAASSRRTNGTTEGFEGSVRWSVGPLPRWSVGPVVRWDRRRVS